MRGTIIAVRDRALTQLQHERAPLAPRPIPLQQRLWRQVAGEVRWSFTPPALWLEGIAFNVVLSGLYLLISPLTLHKHGWVVIIGVYFATFVLADVTTTNVLGVDTARVRLSLGEGLPMWRILLVKNLSLLVIVGVPTLAATAIITAATTRHSLHAIAITVPDVALPILAWLGVGNLVSALLAVQPRSLMRRWQERRQWRTTLPWVTHLGLPYALYYFVAPIDGQQRGILGYHLGRSMPADFRALIHLGVGLTVWAIGTVLAVWFMRWRGLRIL
ncbi:hypothetical protein ACIP5Y_35785 [Nocardia sp. NPDC088792]|uniref:hypothetical protein n=1 Tax=Nocardia sp. NPDC088792 TaxID=3364332 RepID=UPI0038098D36